MTPDTRTTENHEPRTEAGKSLYRGMLARYHEGSIGRLVVTDDWLPTILAIEAEAAATMGNQYAAANLAEAAQEAAPEDSGAGLGYDECEAALKEGVAALNRLAGKEATVGD